MPDPYTGSGWSDPTQGNSNQSIFGSQAMPQMSGGVPNPGNYGRPVGANEVNRNMGILNAQTAQYKNQLAPLFTNAMSQYGGDAANYFKQLMNLGSPYYKQQQTAGFNQGVQQNQNAMSDAQQRLQQSGYGYTPSGTNAAMIGGMEQQGSQNLAEQYLQNLFQNENLQAQGASGLSGIAGMFNPSQLLSGTSLGANVQASPTFGQELSGIMGGIGQMFGGAGNLIHK